MLKQEAHSHEAAGQWQEAETVSRQSLDLTWEQNKPAMEYKAHDDSRNLYTFRDHKERAEFELF